MTKIVKGETLNLDEFVVAVRAVAQECHDLAVMIKVPCPQAALDVLEATDEALRNVQKSSGHTYASIEALRGDLTDLRAQAFGEIALKCGMPGNHQV